MNPLAAAGRERGDTLRGAAAGVFAAAVWAAGEPLLGRLVGTRYSDVRLLGRAAMSGRRGWPAAGLALHLANGAVFAAPFSSERD